MTARLPISGSDDGTWGYILNDFLSVEHNNDGTLKRSGQIVTAEQTVNKGAPNGYASLDATGKLPTAQLGDMNADSTMFLRGDRTWATLPSVPVTSVAGKVGGVTLVEEDITNLTTDLAAKASDDTVIHLSGTETIVGAKDFTNGMTVRGVNVVTDTDIRLTDQRTPLDDSVTDAKISSTAAIAQSKIFGLISSLNSKTPTFTVTATVTSTYTSNPNELVLCDASSGTFAVTLPSANTAGQQVIVVKGDNSSHLVTIQTAGTDIINTSSTSVTLSLQDEALTLTSSGLGKWVVSAGQKSLSSLDSRYVAKGSQIVNVKDYGAKGDGVTDDTAAITAALAAGGITLFPSGTFIHTGLTLPSGARLCGVGSSGYVKNYAPANQIPIPQIARSTLQLKAGANTDSITIPAGTAHGLIEYLEIDGNKSGQTGSSGCGINLLAAANPEEAQWKFNKIYVHDTCTHGLNIGSNRQGCSTIQSIYFSCGTSDTVSGSGIVISGSDTTVDTCFIGVAWGDSIKLLSSVSRIVNSEMFSNVTSGVVVGAGIALADGYGCSRNVIAHCTLDRCAGHGLYVGTNSISNTFTSNIFHSNSQKANGSYFHAYIKETGNLLADNQFCRNDAAASPNKPNYAVFVSSGKNVYGKSMNAIDSAAYNTASINDPTLIITPNL
jgi:hypothetical protein